jgi:general stress protein CsbA
MHGLLTPGRWRPIALGLIVGYAILAGYAGMLSPQPASRADFAWQHSAELIGIFAATPLLHLFVPATLTVIYAVMRTLTWRAVTVLTVALAFAVVAQDFTRVFTIISTPLLIDAARTIAVNRPSAVTWLWPLALVQLHLAGTNLLWAHGQDIRIGP